MAVLPVFFAPMIELMPGPWASALGEELRQPYIRELDGFLEQAEAGGETVFPSREQRFAAFEATTPQQVRVVILGQDPYPTPGHAHGLAFSVQPGVAPLPKSLKNIYTELAEDLGVSNLSGHLGPWCEQGVLLLNSVLTVASGQPGSHAKRGWERFTDAVICHLDQSREGLVFLLWGAYAQKKGKAIDRDRHLVIESAHPSPLSAYRGFFGSRPFSRINEYLANRGQPPIDWRT